MYLIAKVSMILCFILAVYGVVIMIFDIIARIKLWRHRKAADARIIQQAKGIGVWDKEPIVLGGRALELKAWQEYKLKREPGEPDAHLRARIMKQAEQKKAGIQ